MPDPPLGQYVRYADQPLGSWAGGSTRAIAADPPGTMLAAIDNRCWVGTATIERAADFSFFPGYSRIHLPLSGAGVRLAFRESGAIIELAVYQQHQFDGAAPLHATLRAGPVVAFNLIFRSGLAATAQVLRLDQNWAVSDMMTEPVATEPAILRVVYAASGVVTLSLAGQPAAQLDAGDALVLDPSTSHDQLALGGAAVAVLAEIREP